MEAILLMTQWLLVTRELHPPRVMNGSRQTVTNVACLHVISSSQFDYINVREDKVDQGMPELWHDGWMGSYCLIKAN